jgi:hypothetical protein
MAIDDGDYQPRTGGRYITIGSGEQSYEKWVPDEPVRQPEAPVQQPAAPAAPAQDNPYAGMTTEQILGQFFGNGGGSPAPTPEPVAPPAPVPEAPPAPQPPAPPPNFLPPNIVPNTPAPTPEPPAGLLGGGSAATPNPAPEPPIWTPPPIQQPAPMPVAPPAPPPPPEAPAAPTPAPPPPPAPTPPPAPVPPPVPALSTQQLGLLGAQSEYPTQNNVTSTPTQPASPGVTPNPSTGLPDYGGGGGSTLGTVGTPGVVQKDNLWGTGFGTPEGVYNGNPLGGTLAANFPNPAKGSILPAGSPQWLYPYQPSPSSVDMTLPTARVVPAMPWAGSSSNGILDQIKNNQALSRFRMSGLLGSR